MTVTRRRRVAVVINDMNSTGGIQRVAANLVRDLQPWYDAMLLSIEPLRNPSFLDGGDCFRSLDFVRNTHSRRELLRSMTAVGFKLRRFVRTNDIDTVIAVWYDWSVVAALALPRSVRKIGWEHISFDEPTAKWQWIRSKIYPYLDAVVSLTEGDRLEFARFARKVQRIPNYPTISPRPATSREKVLLTIGHLISRKGIDRLLWALKQPLLENPDWKLVVVGGGEKGHADWGYLDWVVTLMQMLQIQDRVEFFPATTEIDDWYGRASIYVMGSRREGLPMVLIEAKAHGIPVVSFDCPTGPKDIIRSGVDGFLIENDSIAFGRRVSELMRDASLREQMGRAGVEDVEQRFSKAEVIRTWVRLIETLHSKKKAA